MLITDFTESHVPQALQLARQAYEEERQAVQALPPIKDLPGFSGRGVSAIDCDRLVGFYCWNEPVSNHFGLTKGCWSPVHAHGAIMENRGEIYGRLYQAAAERLVSCGVLSHSATLYAHDSETLKTFFFNGFGGRCVDAIRLATPFETLDEGIECRQASMQDPQDAEALSDMSEQLKKELGKSPIFLVPHAPDMNILANESDCAFFVALKDNRFLAFMRIEKEGESFASLDKSVMNITGAYAIPEARGTGAAQSLLSFALGWLKERGYVRCGVDFETFNPSGSKFWQKHFAAYTYGVVRRIDERAFKGRN
ncbi:MAG: GNAT family N-acetyltransferase [Clostridiales bacterium]|jgi:GNAT superfamily N-acetyltransferase|nr:GNAT family N-acetyltransferase [Clostridiales bacterium]